MRDRLPGHELLMLPDQTQLVLMKRFEAAELAGKLLGQDIETTDTFVVRSVDNKVTYYEITPKSNPTTSDCCWDFIYKNCFAERCRKTGFAFDVTNLQTGEKVAIIEAPPALDEDCCGTICCGCCCCPVFTCNSMRNATWTTVPNRAGDKPRVLAKVVKQPLYNPCCCVGDALGGDCCNKRFEVSFPDGLPGQTLEPVYLYNDYCETFRNPIKCCTCQCQSAELLIAGRSSIDLKPGTGAGQMGEPSSLLGRILGSSWADEYEPTTGNTAIQNRYAPIARRPDPTTTAEALKQSKENLLTKDSYLIEVPRDDAEQKVGLITATVLYHTKWG